MKNYRWYRCSNLRCGETIAVLEKPRQCSKCGEVKFIPVKPVSRRKETNYLNKNHRNA